MKRTLRMLCLCIVAAVSAVSFAQTDFTHKVLNADAEKGMLGWDVTYIDGGHVWNKQVKGEEKAVGYHGYNNWALENWRNNAGGLTDGSIFQVVKDLPNGTYVFGAYATATRDAWEPSIDQIEGVYLFANEHSVPVATHRVEGMDVKWAHAIKFNVATTVTDGTIKFGMKTEATNACFITMDNATLYYFEDMALEAALDEMAKIDMAATVAKVAPYLEAGKMNVDTVAWIQSAIEAAATVTAETAAQVDEDLWWGKRQAVKSVAQYENFAKAIASAKVIAEGEWTDFGTTVAALEALNALIAEAEAAYAEATVEKYEMEAMIAGLRDAAALVELDGCYTLLDVYTEKMDAMVVGDEIGEYTEAQADEALALWEEASLVLAMVEEGELSPVTAKADCEKYFAQIDQIIANPIDYSEFPIFLHRGDTLLPNQGSGERNQAYKVLDGAYVENIPAGYDVDGNAYGARNGVIHYKSPLFRFREPLRKVRIIVHECGADFQKDNAKMHASFCLGSFAMYDEYGAEIELTVDNVVTNANEPKEGRGIYGLLDGNPGTFFHSLWSSVTPQEHYLEITLPEGEYSAFSFKMVALSNSHSRAFPAEVEITYVSELMTELQQTIVAAREYNPLFGTGPGFCNFDPYVYEAVLAEGDAVVEKEGASDSEIRAAIEKVKALHEQLKEATMDMPDPEKKYRVVCGAPCFFEQQNVVKAMTIQNDTTYGDWLWWETASADSAHQELIFEPFGVVNGKAYYAIKNAASGLYLGEYHDAEDRVVENIFVFSERKDSFMLRGLGYGQFGIYREGNSRQQLHTNDHNSGVPTNEMGPNSKVPGTVNGVRSVIITWATNANATSSWFIREMSTLPCAAKSISDLAFRSAAISLFQGINLVSLTADKECAFDGLTIYDVFGNVVAYDELKVDGKVATLKLSKSMETLSFAFTNAEGIAEVELNGSYKYDGVSAAYTALQNTYNTVLALNPVEGTDVGQVIDLSAYIDALAIAEGLLEEGAEDAALEAAAVALEAAANGLVYNLPKADTDYLILLGIDAIKTNHLTDMAVFADMEQGGVLRWTYVSLTNEAYRWRFIDCGELKHGRNAYYIQSVSNDCYVARTIDSAASIFLVEDSTETRPYDIFFLNSGKVAVTDTYWSNGEAALHPNAHGNGAAANKGNRMITWGRTDAASAMRIVEAEKYITDVVYSINGIENIDVTDEFVAPAVKGTFDLFGRRVMTPATTGIYIIDGKKTVVKK